eukprot:394480-Alexandrium_andersonii.AAC.1
MSASLVGSEMCIRDRPHSLLGGLPPLPDTHPARRRNRCSGWSGDTSPVSYTHLTLPTICRV